jgi:hypothetical protein
LALFAERLSSSRFWAGHGIGVTISLNCESAPDDNPA